MVGTNVGAVLTATAGTLEMIMLQDVVVGDVYLCSGQSNMELSVGASFDYETGASQADHAGDNIRVFWVDKHAEDDEPIFDVKDVKKPWTAASRESIVGTAHDDFDGQFSATCWYFGYNTWLNVLVDDDIPVGLIASHWGGTNIEAWMSPAALADCADNVVAYGDPAPNDHPSSLYNGMIAPLIDTAIKGAIWYQGETNVGASDFYSCALPAMILDWRAKFGYEFPFGIVQLSGYGDDSDASVQVSDDLHTLLVHNRRSTNPLVRLCRRIRSSWLTCDWPSSTRLRPFPRHSLPSRWTWKIPTRSTTRSPTSTLGINWRWGSDLRMLGAWRCTGFKERRTAL